MLFSVIIPTYNREKLIGRAIKSVLNQSFEDFEIIVIDDGSEDRTEHVVNSFKDERIKYIYQENAERSVARNKGIQNTSGQWICFLDSDDVYLPYHLSTLESNISKNDDPKLFITGNLIQNENIKIEHQLIDTLNSNILEEIANKFILMNSVCVHSSILIKNRFDPKYNIWEDTHLWLRIAAQYPIIQITKYTVVQMINDESSVQRGLIKVKIENVKSYINAISDLKYNYINLFKNKLDRDFFDNYIQKKYKLYLYQARQNRQLLISLIILKLAFRHSFSFSLITEIPKIILNKIGLGIHKK